VSKVVYLHVSHVSECVYMCVVMCVCRYSKFDAATGVPTHDKDGQALEGKVRSHSAPTCLLCVQCDTLVGLCKEL
jgi:hypothetical protein